MVTIKEQETYVELELFDGETKIGNAEVDVANKMLSRFEIYEPYQNKGYGTEALKQLIDKYNIDVLWVRSDNKRAIHVYEKCGFEIDESTMYSMVR
jgi:RimJ/RimL family protein N-acetyltransferase